MCPKKGNSMVKTIELLFLKLIRKFETFSRDYTSYSRRLW